MPWYLWLASSPPAYQLISRKDSIGAVNEPRCMTVTLVVALKYKSPNQNLLVSSVKESGWYSDGHLNMQDQFPGFLLQYALMLILNVSYISS